MRTCRTHEDAWGAWNASAGNVRARSRASGSKSAMRLMAQAVQCATRVSISISMPTRMISAAVPFVPSNCGAAQRRGSSTEEAAWLHWRAAGRRGRRRADRAKQCSEIEPHAARRRAAHGSFCVGQSGYGEEGEVQDSAGERTVRDMRLRRSRRGIFTKKMSCSSPLGAMLAKKTSNGSVERMSGMNLERRRRRR